MPRYDRIVQKIKRHSMISISIDTENDAFSEGHRGQEISRILQILANYFAANDYRTSTKYQNLYDANGNKCGTVRDLGGVEFG